MSPRRSGQSTLDLGDLTLNLCRKIAAFRHSTRWMVRLTQTSLFLVCGVSAFLIRFEFALPATQRRSLLVALAVWILLKPLVFYLFHLDQGWWRYVSARDVLQIVKTNLVASLASALVIFAAVPNSSRSVILADFLFSVIATCGMRLAVRMAVEVVQNNANISSCKRALIYGAGEAGSTLIRELRHSSLGYHVIGFIDDNLSKKGLVIDGCRVLGRGTDLEKVVAVNHIDVVLIAAPAATQKQMVNILNRCRTAEVECKTIPTLAQMIQGDRLAPQIRDVAVEDLLGREPVQLDEEKIRRRLQGETVLVTGAAGSIGSELCRQILRFKPAELVAFDISETGIFYLENELHELDQTVKVAAEIGNIQDQRRLADLFSEHRPSIVFHAAAYKHVPLMENHIFQAVENNILGTYRVATAASTYGVRDFVMISTDKAVEPTNVMGATKRAAELVIQSFEKSKTKYVSVRFGNVLGSNGSVIPLFKKQIAAGGPVSVTHPEMTRYFMTTSEAAQLVLQAGAMGQDGEIFVLNMGTPVKISDLAQNLIFLSGLRVGTDIEIKYTGLRPGEKLTEKLHAANEVLLPTSHSKISIFKTPVYNRQEIHVYIESLAELCASRDRNRLLLLLKCLMPEYNPSGHILAKVLNTHRTDHAIRLASAS